MNRGEREYPPTLTGPDFLGVDGEHPPAAIIEQLRATKVTSPSRSDVVGSVDTTVEGVYPPILEKRPTVDPVKALATIKASVRFQEIDPSLKVGEDRIGLRRFFPGGRVETYDEKLAREEQRGEYESASFGMAEIGGQKCVVYATHWGFFAGSLGVVAGEKFMRAAELATRNRFTLVGIYSSAGVRQQENFPGLRQMQRMVAGLESFKSATHQPYISVLLGQVWGGISASVATLGDVTVAVEGTDFGFSGPRVIESYTYQAVPPGAQSVEAHTLNRGIDLQLKDVSQLLGWLPGYFRLTTSQRKLRSGDLPKIKAKLPSNWRRVLPYDQDGFHLPTSLEPMDSARQEFNSGNGKAHPKTLFDQFVDLSRNPGQIDTEQILTHGFDSMIPLYNSFVIRDHVRYPAIIAALANLGPETFLVIGNQPSYQKVGDQEYMIPSSPSPDDFEYLLRMLEMGDRLGVSVVFCCNTLGAKPTLEAEYRGQARHIAQVLQATNAYKHPVITYVTGVLGSGGGLATAPIGDHFAMRRGAMAFVAEPVSAASILYNEPFPSQQQVEATINTMRATAVDQLDLGLIDFVLDERDDPFEEIRLMRHHLAEVAAELNGIRIPRLLERRYQRSKRQQGLPLQH